MPLKDNVYNSKGFVKSNDDIKSQIITKEQEEIKSKGGIMSKFFGTDKNMAATNMGFMITVFFILMMLACMVWFPEHTNDMIALVTLGLGYTIGSKKSE